MKHIGCELSFKSQRDSELFAHYKKYIATHDVIRVHDMLQVLVDCPSSRFWISEGRAAIVIGAMMRGETFDDATPLKKELYNEIFKRAMAEMKKRPMMSIYDIASIVVEQKAPKFYMSASSADVILQRAKKKAWEKDIKLKYFT